MGEPPSKIGNSRDCNGIESLSMEVLSSSAASRLAKLRSLELRLGNLRRVRASQIAHKRVRANPILESRDISNHTVRLLSRQALFMFLSGKYFLVSYN